MICLGLECILQRLTLERMRPYSPFVLLHIRALLVLDGLVPAVFGNMFGIRVLVGKGRPSQVAFPEDCRNDMLRLNIMEQILCA